MENKGLISVIIPVYNVEKYLKECVDSVLNQTYQNFEIILVDDGSTDFSGKICDEYALISDKIKVVHQKNGGLSFARNQGFLLSEGEYIYFLDSDDYIAEKAFEKLVLVIDKSDADFVYFDSNSFIDGKGEAGVPQNYLRSREYEADSGINALNILQNNKDYHSAVPLLLFKSIFLKNNNLIFAEKIVYEDMLFTYQAYCKAQRVSHCNEALYFRRYRENSIMTSTKSISNFESCVQVFKEVLSFSQLNKIETTEAATKYLIRCAFNIFNVFEKLSKEDKASAEKLLVEMKKYILLNNAFGNKALKMRCYGKVFWFFQKVIEKILG